MIFPPLSPTELVRLASLQPHIQDAFLQLRTAVLTRLGLVLYLGSATRTFDDQDALYSGGRTKPGAIVTNSRAGQSWHNFGLAFDCAVTDPNTHKILNWTMPASVGDMAGWFGLEWGGDWATFRDENHFQFTAQMSLSDALARWPEGWSVRTAEAP